MGPCQVITLEVRHVEIGQSFSHLVGNKAAKVKRPRWRTGLLMAKYQGVFKTPKGSRIPGKQVEFLPPSDP